MSCLLHVEFQTAYFVIPENVEHGEELICSYFACRNAGIKFRYCTHCKVPVAKRNFRKRHKHGKTSSVADADDDSNSGDEEASTEKDKPVIGPPATCIPAVPPAVVTKKETVLPPPAPKPEVKAKAGKAKNGDKAMTLPVTNGAKKGGAPAKVPKEAKKDKAVAPELPPIPSQKSQKIDAERERRWAALLSKRPPTKDGSAMSGWLMEVLAVSDLETPLKDVSMYSPQPGPGDTVRATPAASGNGSKLGASSAAPAASTPKEPKALPTSKPAQTTNGSSKPSVLVKKKRPLAIMQKGEGNSEDKKEVSSSSLPPEKEGGGGFAEWKDRKKHKGLVKKGLAG